ncbi:MAG: hypothetical protein KGL39_58600 [Patescibacteria group bacterium]|nr:hypothetical protein [Patescibacteria group bacterium]
MATVKHTPAPWEQNANMIMGEGRVVAQLHGNATIRVNGRARSVQDDQDKANALLILAAPHLLLALQAAETALVAAYGEPDPKWGLQNTAGRTAILLVREAIARTEGQP